jgi:hypothetical protein
MQHNTTVQQHMRTTTYVDKQSGYRRHANKDRFTITLTMTNNNTVMYTIMAVPLYITIKLVPAAPHSASHCMRNIMNRFVYHTRGTNGIVKVLDAGYLPSAHTPSYGDATGTHSKAHTSIFQVETLSRTFCATPSCSGDCNLMVTPSKEECIATLYDIQRSPVDGPILQLHGAGRPGSSARNFKPVQGVSLSSSEHGMITSLSMCSNKVASSLIVACGMESGDLYLHDCRYLASIHSTGQKNDIHLSEKVQKGDALAIKTPYGHPSTPPTPGMSLISQSLSGLSAE